MAKYLDYQGVSTLWSKMKSYVDTRFSDYIAFNVTRYGYTSENKYYLLFKCDRRSDPRNWGACHVKAMLGGYDYGAIEMVDFVMTLRDMPYFYGTRIGKTNQDKVMLYGCMKDDTIYLIAKCTNYFTLNIESISCPNMFMNKIYKEETTITQDEFDSMTIVNSLNNLTILGS